MRTNVSALHLPRELPHLLETVTVIVAADCRRRLPAWNRTVAVRWGQTGMDTYENSVGQLTLANFQEFFTDSYYLRSFWKSMVLGVAAVFTTSVLGIAVAFLLIRYDFPGRNLFSYLTMLPMILPPLVGVLGFVFIFGRAGTVNILLTDWLGMEKPINFMYGTHGVLLVETVHLFPMITLSVLDALSKVDPTLEEAAEGMGAKGWRKFWDITLPLTTPGYVSGALLVFIWDLRRLHYAARARRAGPAGTAGLSQHRAVRRPAHLPHGHRDLGAARRSCHPVRAGRPPICGGEGL
jgi:ABC-type spermidine/putrescine transport system permease subunit II